jgi:hypothetical protein
MAKRQMFSDPVPFDEDDPEAMEEMFELYKSLGKTPADLPNITEKERKEYAEWLQENS